MSSKKNKTNKPVVENKPIESINDNTPVVPENSAPVEAPVEAPKDVETTLPDVSAKDAFLAALYSNGGKYALSVNGVQLCTYQNKPVIVAYDTYFELNGIPHSFNGIEIKHID